MHLISSVKLLKKNVSNFLLSLIKHFWALEVLNYLDMHLKMHVLKYYEGFQGTSFQFKLMLYQFFSCYWCNFVHVILFQQLTRLQETNGSVSKELSEKLLSRLPSHKYKPVSLKGKGKSIDKDEESELYKL